MRSAFVAVALFALLIAGCVDAQGATRPQNGTLKCYTADWCQPCQREKPAVKALAADAKVKIVTVDCTDHAPPHIKTLPTYEVYDSQGRLKATVNDLPGLKRAFKALKWLKSLFS